MMGALGGGKPKLKHLEQPEEREATGGGESEVAAEKGPGVHAGAALLAGILTGAKKPAVSQVLLSFCWFLPEHRRRQLVSKITQEERIVARTAKMGGPEYTAEEMEARKKELEQKAAVAKKSSDKVSLDSVLIHRSSLFQRSPALARAARTMTTPRRKPRRKRKRKKRRKSKRKLRRRRRRRQPMQSASAKRSERPRRPRRKNVERRGRLRRTRKKKKRTARGRKRKRRNAVGKKRKMKSSARLPVYLPLTLRRGSSSARRGATPC